jgi:hypothetical protein
MLYLLICSQHFLLLQENFDILRWLLLLSKNRRDESYFLTMYNFRYSKMAPKETNYYEEFIRQFLSVVFYEVQLTIPIS